MKQRRIDVIFKPSVKQKIALDYLLDDTTNFVGYGGSGYSGKSYLLCYWLTMMCLSYPDTGWGLGRRELSNLKKTTLLTLFKVFGECKMIPGTDYNYNQQQNIVTFSNKSQIFLLDTAFQPSDPLYTRFGGLELTGCAIDESAETNEAAVGILFVRTGRRNNSGIIKRMINGKVKDVPYKLKRKILETFNPDKGHVYRRYYVPWKSGSLKDTYQFVKALPSDNPSPDVEEHIADIIANNDEVTVQRLVYGNFEYDADKTALINIDKAHDVFSNVHVPEGNKYVTADIARLGGDRIVIIEWSGLRGKITAYDKKLLTDVTTYIESARIRNSCGKSDVLVDSDGLGSGVQDFGGFKGFVNNSAAMPDPKKPLGADGKPIKENFDNLKSQCGFRMAELINSNAIYLECEDWMKDLIIQEMEQVKMKQLDSDMKKGLIPKHIVKEKLGRSPDFWDAIMMRIYFELKPKFVLTATSINDTDNIRDMPVTHFKASEL